MTFAQQLRLAVLIRRLKSAEWHHHHILSQQYCRRLVFGYLASSSIHTSHTQYSSGHATLLSGEAQAGGSCLWAPHALGALLTLGVGVATLASQEVTPALKAWPAEVREDIRRGLQARTRGDLERSEKHLARAFCTLISLPVERYSPDPYLKLTSLLIVLADVLEEERQISRAYATYILALFTGQFGPIKSTNKLVRKYLAKCDITKDTKDETVPHLPIKVPPTYQNRMHAVSLSLKLADMAEQLDKPLKDRFSFLSCASSLVPPPPPSVSTTQVAVGETLSTTTISNVSPPREANVQSDLELPLPAWVSSIKGNNRGGDDVIALAAPFERLGSFLAELEHTEPAIINLVKAREIFRTSRVTDQDSQIINKCRTAHLMNKCGAVLIRLHQKIQCTPPDPAARFPPIPPVASTLNIPKITVHIDDEPILPDNLLRLAHDFIIDAYTTSFEFHVVAKSGTNSKGESVDLESYGFCANVFLESLMNLGETYELNGDRDVARSVFDLSLTFSRVFHFSEGVDAAKSCLRRMNEAERRAGISSSNVSKGKSIDLDDYECIM